MAKKTDPAKIIEDMATAIDNMPSLSAKFDMSGATSQLIEFNGIVGNMYTLQDKVLDQLDRQQEYNDKKIKEYKKLADQNKDNLEYHKKLIGYVEKLEKRNSEIEDQRETAIKDTGEFNKLLTTQGLKTKGLDVAQQALGKTFGMVLAVAEVYMTVFKALAAVSDRVIQWQDKLQKSLGGLAIQFGSTTEAIRGMRDEGLNQLMDVNGLGGLGLGLDDIVHRLADFNQSMEFTNKISQKTAAGMVKMGIGIGLNAAEVGELARSFMLAGQSVEDTTKFMKSIASAAGQAGVSAKALTKQFQGAGRAIYDLSGPEARKDLVRTAMELAKIGTGLDKISGFTNMTLSFDKTVDSMAKLNTVFGTHINALEVFAEQDPAKQFKIIQDAVAGAGMKLDNMTRAQKQFMMQALNMDAQTIEAMITRSKMSKEELDAEAKMAALAKQKQEAQGAYEKSLQKSKMMLVAEETITAHVNDMLTKQMAPFYDGWAKGGGILGGAEMFNSYVESWTKKIDGFSNALGEQGLGGIMMGIGNTFGHIWQTITDFITSDSVAVFLSGLMSAFSVISDLISGIIDVISPVIKLVLYLIGKFLEIVSPVLKFFSAGVKAFGSIVGAGLDAVGQSMTGETRTDGTFMRKVNETTANYSKDQEAGLEGIGGFFGAGTVSPKTSGAMVVSGARADGGAVERGKYYLTGENGPELFHAPAAGNITPAPQTAAMMNSAPPDQTIHVHVTLDGEKIQDIMYKNNMRRQA